MSDNERASRIVRIVQIPFQPLSVNRLKASWFYGLPMAQGIARIWLHMAVATFWVVAYEHGTRRHTDGNHRCTLPQHPDLQHLLRDVRASEATRGPYLAGLLRAAPGRANHAHFNFEERCLNSYFGVHEQCYSISVVEFWETVEQVPVFECMHPPAHLPWNLNTSISLPAHTYRRVAVKRGRTTQTAEDALQDWLQLPDDVSDSQLLGIRLIAVVEPIKQLIAAGRWHSVVLPLPQHRARRTSAFRLPMGRLADHWLEWPPARNQCPDPHPEPPTENLFQTLWRVQEFLRTRAQADGDDKDTAQDLAVAMFHCLDHLEGDPIGPPRSISAISTSEYLSLAVLALLQRSTTSTAFELPRP